jgi:riboflavin biosynthesis pyrimidine reductase
MGRKKAVNLTYSSHMSVIATINVGRNGATSINGGSQGLSSAEDRQRFLTLHRSAGSYLVGRNSYLAERYSSTSTPIYILSESNLPIDGAPANLTVIAGRTLIESAQEIYKKGPHPIVVEAGVSLLIPLIESGCIDELELSISPIDGDAHFVDVEVILSHFEIVEDYLVDGTRILKGRYQGDSAYREDNS